MSVVARLAPLSCLLVLASALPSAQAAESYDNCTGFIDVLPATISTQGVWCLRAHLATGITSGAAITIAANNVTIDCNDFKIGGLQAGAASQALGVTAVSRMNATVRNCGIRGFYQGLWLDGSGHLVENNRLDGNLFVGISVIGDGNRVQGNRVFDTGGSTTFALAYGIYAYADVIDNTVENVVAVGADTSGYGIVARGVGSEVSGNRVRGVVATGSGDLRGLVATEQAMVISGNRVSAAVANVGGIGINAAGANSFCKDNAVHGYHVAYVSCDNAIGNLPLIP